MKKNKFNIPDRKYVHGEKRMVSMRLPEDLIEVLNELSKQKGWPLTDLVVTALDQYARYEKAQKKQK